MGKKLLLAAVAVLFTVSSFAQAVADFEPMPVLQTTADIEIDGYPDEDVWGRVDAVPVTNDIAGDTGDIATEFKILWKPEGFYLFVLVTDDSVVDWADPAADHETDNVELFFHFNGDDATVDYSTEGSVAYVSGATAQIRVKSNEDQEATTGTLAESDPAIEFVVVPNPGEGYQFEIFIPQAAYAARPEDLVADMKVLFEVTVGDADEGENDGLRNAQLAWYNNTGVDNAWQDINYMGSIVLLADVPEAVEANELSSVNVYPNPASGMLNVVGAVKVEISNVLGQTVKVVENISNAQVNVSDLTEGVYVVSVTDAAGNVSSQKVMIK